MVAGIHGVNLIRMKKFEITEVADSESNPFDRQERISWWSQQKLKDAKVMVVGAGAIGNETLKNLALLGIGNIFIVDFDTISTSNLSRTVLFRKEDVGKKKAEVAAAKTRELALVDDINIHWFHGDLVWEIGTGLYQEMDIVLGCLDNVETRIAVNKNCWLTNTPWIDAGTQELGLRVEFYKPPILPCYQCNLTTEQLQNVNKRYSCDFFKRKAFEAGKIPTTQIASAIVSAFQVQEAIKYLCGQPVAVGKKIYYQGTINDYDVFSKNQNDHCLAHVTYDEIIDIPLSIQASLHAFLDFVSQEAYSGENATLDFRGDRTFVHSISCKKCGDPIVLNRPTFRIEDEETNCNNCPEKETSRFESGETAVKKITQEQFNFENSSEALLEMSLSAIGVPIFHIVAVLSEKGGYKYYRLTGDKAEILPNFN